MREIDGMTYADLADALDVTVPAVKSLLVRARVGLVEAAEARDADCAEIRADLLRAYDRGVKASGRARKHMRSCDGCREYRVALRGMRRSFAALSPIGVGPLAFAAKLIGLGGSAAVPPRAARAGGGSAAVAGGGVATATACKVAAVVCTAAIATGGAVEVNHKISAPRPRAARAAPRPSRRAPRTRRRMRAPVARRARRQAAGRDATRPPRGRRGARRQEARAHGRRRHQAQAEGRRRAHRSRSRTTTRRRRPPPTRSSRPAASIAPDAPAREPDRRPP